MPNEKYIDDLYNHIKNNEEFMIPSKSTGELRFDTFTWINKIIALDDVEPDETMKAMKATYNDLINDMESARNEQLQAETELADLQARANADKNLMKIWKHYIPKTLVDISTSSSSIDSREREKMMTKDNYTKQLLGAINKYATALRKSAINQTRNLVQILNTHLTIYREPYDQKWMIIDQGASKGGRQYYNEGLESLKNYAPLHRMRIPVIE